MSRSEVVTNVSRIIESIEQNGIKYIVDDHSSSLDRCRLLESGITVLTSKRAIHSYDKNHPERIVCILVKPDTSIRVFVNNRESEGVNNTVSRFWNVDFMKMYSTLSCGICYATSKCKKTLKVAVCPYCSFMACESCLRKMTKMNKMNTLSRRCAQCRTWLLTGPEFGTPLDLLGGFPMQSTCDDPIDSFVDIVSHLDGFVVVCPQIGDRMDSRNFMSVCKLSGTTRYMEDDMTPDELRSSLNKLWKKHRDWNFYLYVHRMTFRIDVDKEKHVDEVSRFQITPDGCLWHLDPLSWKIDILQNYLEGSHLVPKSLTPSHHFEMPEVCNLFFRQINTDYPDKVKIVSMCTKNSLNFDMDKDGTCTTMSPEMLARMTWISMKETTSVAVIAFARMIDDTETNASLVAYRLFEDPARIERLTSSESKRNFHRNLDGLKTRVWINKFL